MYSNFFRLQAYHQEQQVFMTYYNKITLKNAQFNLKH